MLLSLYKMQPGYSATAQHSSRWLLLLLNLIISYRIIIVEPGGPRRPFFSYSRLGNFIHFKKSIVLVQVKPLVLKMALLLLWFPCKDSHQKLTCHFLHFCSSYSRTTILLKSGDDRPPGRPLFGDIFCTLAAGFF